MATAAGASNGAMKRPAPDGGQPPAAKARVAKSSPAGAPPSAAKAPVAKSPVAKAPVAKSPVAKAPAQPAPQEANSGGSPTAEEAKPVRRTDTWKDFENTDPLYALFGQVSQSKVLGADGIFHPDRLEEYLRTIFLKKAAKKPKDWVEIWAAMDIPVTNQVIVLEPILVFGLQHAPETLGRILAELLKGHRIKTKTIEESVVGAFKGQPDKHGILRELFFLIFPKGPQSEWGWSRVGWSWQEWWKITENCFNGIDKSSAFDELSALLNHIEAEGKTGLSKQSMVWNEKRLGQVRSALCRYGELEDQSDLVACLDATLS